MSKRVVFKTAVLSGFESLVVADVNGNGEVALVRVMDLDSMSDETPSTFARSWGDVESLLWDIVSDVGEDLISAEEKTEFVTEAMDEIKKEARKAAMKS